MNKKAMQWYLECKKQLDYYVVSESFLRDVIKKLEHVIDLAPTLTHAWYHKGVAHLRLSENAEALVAFEAALALDPQHIESKEGIKRVLFQQKEHPKNLFKLLFEPMRQVFCTPDYLQQFQQLIEKKNKIGQLNYLQQVDFILELMDFLFKYYEVDSLPYSFTNKVLFENSKQGKTLRLHGFGNLLAQYKTPSNSHGQTAEYIEQVFGKLAPVTVKELLLDEPKIVIRIIFEVMRQLPREKRGELVDSLPWGPNSWHFLEFFGSIFQPDALADNDFFTVMSYEEDFFNDQEKKQRLDQYFKSLTDHLCLIKAVVPILIKEEMKTLRDFFLSVKAKEMSNVAIMPIKELPHFRAFLWYHKHLFQFSRLQALLPTALNSQFVPLPLKKVPFIKEDQHLPLVQLQLKRDVLSFPNTLKSRFCFLRVMQVVGEISSRRGLGSYVDQITTIDTEILSYIRNGFSHIEDHTSMILLKSIEGDANLLLKLRRELSHLRQKTFNEIIKRQSYFPQWPDTEGDPDAWLSELRQYWQAVMNYYQPTGFCEDQYVPNQALLGVDAIEHIKTAWRIPQEVPELIKMLQGKKPFVPLGNHELPNKLKEGHNQKKGFKRIKSLLDEAHKKYKSLRTIDKQNALRLSQTLEQTIQLERQRAMTHDYPEINALGLALQAQQAAIHKMSMSDLISCLQDRVRLLLQLIESTDIIADLKQYLNNKVLQSGTYSMSQLNLSIMPINDVLQLIKLNHSLGTEMKLDEPFRKRVKNEIIKDVELFFACSYLVAQTVSVLNKLNSLHVLNVMAPEMVKKLEKYLSLRNALAHSDPLLESQSCFYDKMTSDMPGCLAAFIKELVFSHAETILEADPQNPMYALLLQWQPNQLVKQEQPLSVNIFGLFSSGNAFSPISPLPEIENQPVDGDDVADDCLIPAVPPEEEDSDRFQFK